MKKHLHKTLIILLVGVVFESNATPRPPSPPGIETKAPIDAGLSLLLLAGAGLGIQKLRKKK